MLVGVQVAIEGEGSMVRAMDKCYYYILCVGISVIKT